MSADIHTLPGIERHDLGPEVSVERVIERAREHDLSVIIVIGYGRDGWYLACSAPDMDKNLGMLTRATHDVLHVEPAEIVTIDESS